MEEKTECLEMAKALYQFKATIAKTLSFRESEYFIIYQSTKQRNWWQVINSKTQVGYVPSNYVIPVQVAPDFLIKFIDECITVLRKESDKADGCLPNDRQEVLLKLLERKSQVERLLESKSQTSINVEMSCAPSACSSASRISPPLLLHSQPIKSTQSNSSFVSDSKVEMGKKSEMLERMSLIRDSSQSLDRCHSKDEVSDICGQVGTPLSETRKSLSSTHHPTEGRKSVKKTVLHQQSEPSKSLSNLQQSEGKKNIKITTLQQSEPSKSLSCIPQQLGDSPNAHVSRKISSLDKTITEETVYQLVEQVRCQTSLSHELSRVAVDVVVSELQKYIPKSPVLEKILLIVQGPLTAPKPVIEHTHDAKRLNVIFSELTSCKDDAQQRSWMLHEDEAVIIDYVKELTSILMNADTNISKHVISSDQYSGVVALTQYYQMEVRWSIRQPLLQALGVLCGLDPAIISIFLSSVLPMELARDMKANPRSIPKLSHSALLLTMIFSMGEPMPITHLEHLGVDFLNFLLNRIEDPPDTDIEDQIPNLFTTLILSYNLQFTNVEDNVFLKAISTRSVAKSFTEIILLLLNREDDPVRIFEHEPTPPHSVLKLFIDLFSSSCTANLFYTNDVKVLIDIIVRQLADLSPGDKRRTLYLQLCRVVMRNSKYSEHHHRKDEISKSFTRIFCEETEESLKDQRLVREISNEFPQYFK